MQKENLQLGAVQVKALETGFFRLDGGAMFGVIPKPRWSTQFRADELNRIELGLRCLLLQGPGFNCLVDAGMGDKWAPEAAASFDLQNHSLEFLLHQQAGLGCEDITHLLLTHLHFDHAGGATTFDADGKIKATFLNAEVLLSAKNFATAELPSSRERASYRSENWQLLKMEGRLRLLPHRAELQEVLPGVWVEESHGHTPGQLVVHVLGDRQHLVFASDLVPTTAHFARHWGMGFDVEPLKLMEEKIRLLEAASKQDWILCLGHDPKQAFVQVQSRERNGELDFKLRADRPKDD